MQKPRKASYSRQAGRSRSTIADRRRDRAIGAAAKVGEGVSSALLSLYGRQRRQRWAEAKRSVEVVFKPLLGRPLVALSTGISRCWPMDTVPNMPAVHLRLRAGF